MLTNSKIGDKSIEQHLKDKKNGKAKSSSPKSGSKKGTNAKKGEGEKDS